MEEIIFFSEFGCPYCARLRAEILNPLEATGLISVREIDIHSNRGSKEMGEISQKIFPFLGAEHVPVLKIKNDWELIPKIKRVVGRSSEEDVTKAAKLKEELNIVKQNLLEVLNKPLPPEPFPTHEQWRTGYRMPRAL
jgi:glutaredoxin